MKRNKKAGLYTLMPGDYRNPPDNASGAASGGAFGSTPREESSSRENLTGFKATQRPEQLCEILQREICIDWRKVCALVIDLCGRLSASHRLGIAHGSLSLSKIVAEEDDGWLRNARIVNPTLFTLIASSGAASLQPANLPLFQAEYFLSPEQKAGRTAIPASDVYALGVFMYAAITGSPPPEAAEQGLISFSGKASTSLAGFGIPPQLEAMIFRCLKKDPAERYQNVDELRSAIIWWDPWLDAGNGQFASLRVFLRRRKILAAALILIAGIVSVLFLINSRPDAGSLASAQPNKYSALSVTIRLSPGEFSMKMSGDKSASVNVVADGD